MRENLMMMMAEKAESVLEQVPHNDDIDDEDNEDREWVAGTAGILDGPVQKFVNFDGNKKGRFADGQPPSPAHAEHHSKGFDERKQAVNQGAGRGPQNVGF